MVLSVSNELLPFSPGLGLSADFFLDPVLFNQELFLFHQIGLFRLESLNITLLKVLFFKFLYFLIDIVSLLLQVLLLSIEFIFGTTVWLNFHFNFLIMVV